MADEPLTPLSEILPCPFCGGEAVRQDIEGEQNENFGASYICCKRCWASTALHFDRKENLVPAWNERHRPQNMVMVPKSALDWLFGQGPDADGKWYGDVEPKENPYGLRAPHWWRSHFRKLIAPPDTPDREG